MSKESLSAECYANPANVPERSIKRVRVLLAEYIGPLIGRQRNNKCNGSVVLRAEIILAWLCPPAPIRVRKIVILLLEKYMERRGQDVAWVPHHVLRGISLDSEGYRYIVKHRRRVEWRLHIIDVPALLPPWKLE